MPIYAYRNQATNEVLEEVYPIGKAPHRIRRAGKHYVRDIAAEHRSFRDTPGAWPQESVALAVRPQQVKAMREHIQSISGFTPDFNEKGRVVFHDRDHRAQTIRAFQGFDMDAGYSDPAPRS